MLNILVILTGGTIGSTVNRDYISVESGSKKHKLIELYKDMHPEYAKEISFETIEPYSILSENLSGNHINLLIDCVKKAQKKSIDGIIITHGTDTLQYSAAALGLVFSDTEIPILFVSSNYILEDKRANGLDNFSISVDYIKQHKKPGIYVSYDSFILNSLSLVSHMAYSDKLYHLDTYSKSDDRSYKNIKLTEVSPVLYIKAVPGYPYPLFDNKDIKAVLFETYHSGTLPTGSMEFQNFCRAANAFNIPVYVVGVEDRVQYESTIMYKNLNLKILPKMSPITAYMKLWFLYST